MSKETEEVMGRYAEELERGPATAAVTLVEPTEQTSKQRRVQLQNPQNRSAVGKEINAGTNYGLREKTQKALRIEQEISEKGYHEIPMDSLPSKGKYYPVDMRIFVRSAKGSEIKHWSTMNDEEIASVKDMWNYIVEKCCVVRCQSRPGTSWKDLAEFDELYLLLAIRELTFTDDDNNLFVPVSASKQVAVTKEMVKYISFPETLEKYYSPQERCYKLNLSTGKTINVYMPTFGVNEWIYNYVNRMLQSGVEIDTDFIQYAPILIGDVRGFTDQDYKDFVYRANSEYGVKEWALLAKILEILKGISVPTISYEMEDGTEASIPLNNFLGGSKAIFSVSDPLSILC